MSWGLRLAGEREGLHLHAALRTDEQRLPMNGARQS